MSKQEVLQSKIINWAATRLDEAVFSPKDGYYPFDIIADAYEKGVEHAEKNLKEKMREKYFENAKLLTELVNSSMKELKKMGFKPTKIFISISVSESKIIYAIDEKTYVSSKFLDEAYNLASEFKMKYFERGLVLSFGFVNDGNGLNLEYLESDGFGIAIDLDNNTPIY